MLHFERFSQFLKKQGIPFRENADIRPYLTFRIGGTVRMLVVAQASAQVRVSILRLLDGGLPFVVLGGGSNIVFPDEPAEAVVLVCRNSRIEATGDGRLRAEAGVKNGALLQWCQRVEAGGLEFLAGIPGTVGGSAAVNAGSGGRSLADALATAEIIDEGGNARRVGPDAFGFRYRDSAVKFGGTVILSVDLRCEKAAAGEVQEKIKQAVELRQARHPSYSLLSAGCFFKNPLVNGKKVSAGKIIEECGLKGFRSGDIEVSPVHANFFINRDAGRFSDLEAVAQRVSAEVERQRGIRLQREVVYVSVAGKKY